MPECAIRIARPTHHAAVQQRAVRVRAHRRLLRDLPLPAKLEQIPQGDLIAQQDRSFDLSDPDRIEQEIENWDEDIRRRPPVAMFGLTDHGVDKNFVCRLIDIEPDEPDMRARSHFENAEQKLRPLVELPDVLRDLAFSDFSRW